jgi:hypothetical protein
VVQIHSPRPIFSIRYPSLLVFRSHRCRQNRGGQILSAPPRQFAKMKPRLQIHAADFEPEGREFESFPAALKHLVFRCTRFFRRSKSI